MILQLNPPMPVDTPKGKALAHFLIDYGPEHDLMWVTFVDASGECWTWPNPQIRAQNNVTMGRTIPKKNDPMPAPMNGHANGNGHAPANENRHLPMVNFGVG